MRKLHVGWRVAFGLGLLSAGAIASAQLSGALQMKVTPALGVVVASANVQTLRVEVTNKGEATSGEIEVNENGPVVRTPIELAKNSTKVVQITAPISAFTFRTTVRLITRAGIVSQPIPAQGGVPIVLIGNSSSANWLEEIVQQRNQVPNMRGGSWPNSSEPSKFYTEFEPKDAPSRPIVFRGTPLVVLREGAQNLDDDQVLAVQTYLLRGGNVMIFGGASGSVLRDPRWRQILGTSDWRPSSLPVDGSRDSFTERFGLKTGQPIAISVGNPTLAPVDTQANSTIVWSGTVGLGSIVVTAFDPTDAPLDKGSKRVSYFLALASSEFNRGLGGHIVDNQVRPALGEAVKVPEFTSILMLLVIFAVLVVPVNLFVVRKLNRAYLAWLTAPLLGIGFSFLVMNQAKDIRGLETSKAQAGNMIGDSRVPTVSYRGIHRYFFRNGGKYDLKLKEVDAIAKPPENDQFVYRRRRISERNPFQELGLVDEGTLSARAVNASSLGFFEFEVTKMSKQKPFFSVTRKSSTATGPKYKLKNESPYSFSEIRATYGKLMVSNTSEVKPGETFELQLMRYDPELPSVLITGYVSGFQGVDGDSPLAPGQDNERIRLYYRQSLEGM